MKIYALMCHKLVLTQFWPKVVSWRFEITTDDLDFPDFLGKSFDLSRVGHTMVSLGQFPLMRWLVKKLQNMHVDNVKAF